MLAVLQLHVTRPLGDILVFLPWPLPAFLALPQPQFSMISIWLPKPETLNPTTLNPLTLNPITLYPYDPNS